MDKLEKVLDTFDRKISVPRLLWASLLLGAYIALIDDLTKFMIRSFF